MSGFKMAASTAGKFVGALCAIRGATRRELNVGYLQSCSFLQIRNYAARKGTREKAKKKKVKVVVEKKSFVPHKERSKDTSPLTVDQVRFDDSMKDDLPVDNVWIGKYHKIKVFPLTEAIEYHKETHSLGMLDAPDAYIKALFELDMTGPRPSKNVGKFSRLAATPHFFDHGESRAVAAFCKAPELQEDARAAGAALVGGPELINQIQTGAISVAEYDYTVAHPDMMADLVGIKGLLRKKFPAANNGSLGINLAAMVHKFLHGIKYNGDPHDRQPLYGTSEVIFGKLNMETKHLEENFAAVLRDLNTLQPKRPGPFITRARVTTQLGREFFTVEHSSYLESTKTENDEDDDDDDDDEPTAVAI